MEEKLLKISPKKRVICFISLLTFTLYFLTTLFFIMPNNSLNLKLNNEYQYFDLHFFQRWGFFAPPPTFNEFIAIKFYYRENTINKTATFDILTPIVKDKQKNAPFNRGDEVLDYTLSHTISGIQSDITEYTDLIKFENQKKNRIMTDDQRIKLVVKYIEKTKEFKTLTNYARIVAQNNKIPKTNSCFQITISEKSIPQFADRNLPLKMPEVITFQSNVKAL
jgi:hypothetical protein